MKLKANLTVQMNEDFEAVPPVNVVFSAWEDGESVNAQVVINENDGEIGNMSNQELVALAKGKVKEWFK